VGERGPELTGCVPGPQRAHGSNRTHLLRSCEIDHQTLPSTQLFVFCLQSKAKEMMQLAEKMRLNLLTNSSTQWNSGDEEMGSKQDMQDWLLSVGIVSPVTKETAGALYHQQLSLQVIDSHFHIFSAFVVEDFTIWWPNWDGCDNTRT
jgi:hypothetical protein